MAIVITLAPLVLGLASWTLGAVCLTANGKRLGSVSWMLCAFALWFPLFTICRWVEKGDMAAVMDCVHAYCLCAGVLLAGNVLLHLIGTLTHRKSN